MKIAFDYQIFCLQAYGGISRYYARLASALSSTEEVKIFAPLHCNEYLDSVSRDLVRGTRIAKRASLPVRCAIPYNYAASEFSSSRWGRDIVHETYFSMFQPQRKCPTVVTIYDMVHELFPGQFSKVGNVSARKRMAVDRASKVICISESTRNDLIRLWGVDESRIAVIHLGFDRLLSASTINDRYLDHALNEKPYLLFVGSRGGYKNFEGFIRAYSSSSELKAGFKVISFGGGAFTLREEKLISELGVSDKVIYVGGSDSLLATLYERAAAFIYPSLYEGFGLPPLEAMSKSCPVILSNTSSMPEIVGDAGQYFDPQSPANIREAIERVVFNSVVSDELVARGKKRLANFSWEKCARETLSIYGELT